MKLTQMLGGMPVKKPSLSEPVNAPIVTKPAFDIKSETVDGVRKMTVTRLVEADAKSLEEREGEDIFKTLPAVGPSDSAAGSCG